MNKALVIGIIVLIVLAGAIVWYVSSNDDSPIPYTPYPNESSSLNSDTDVFNEMDNALEGIE